MSVNEELKGGTLVRLELCFALELGFWRLWLFTVWRQQGTPRERKKNQLQTLRSCFFYLETRGNY